MLIRWRRGAVPGVWAGRARHWYDGDTLSIEKGGSGVVVRLWGIDAPEWGQAGAGAAWRELRLCTTGVPVVVWPVAFDRYGRVVARLATYEHPDVGLTLLARGVVWWEYRFAWREREYNEAQRDARSAGLGLWTSAPYGFAPWVWRQRRRIGV